MTGKSIPSIVAAAESRVAANLQHDFIGDRSILSDAFRANPNIADLSEAISQLLKPIKELVGLYVLRTRCAGECHSTMQELAMHIRETLAAATIAVAAGEAAIFREVKILAEFRSHVNAAVQSASALEWLPSGDVSLDAWLDPPNSANGVDWIAEAFAKPIYGVPDVRGSAFQVALVYQLVRHLLKREQEDQWRTVSTPVLAAEFGGNGGRRMILTVSLIPSPIESFIPDIRYFGLTELRHSDQAHCLLASAQRCWKAAQITGFRGVWRLECAPDSSEWDSGPIPHIYGRSFEAAFVCCLRAAFGNAYGEKLPDDEYERQQSLKVDPLSPHVVISAMLGEFDPLKTPIKDIPLAPVTGIPQKLSEVHGGVISQVVFAENQWNEETLSQLTSKDREDRLKSLTAHQTPEDQSRLQWSTAGTIGSALDALLVRSRWLKAWQKATRENWLVRWEDGTARAPNDKEPPGPDNQNPRTTPDAADAKGDDSGGGHEVE